MTVELRSLRITAEMDSAAYVRGMQQKVAADREAVASSNLVVGAQQAVAAANDSVLIKLSPTVNALERLSRQYVDGYGTAQKFNAEILKLARVTDNQTTSVAHLEQVYAGVQRRFGLVADGAELAARGYTELAQAISNVNGRLESHAVAAEKAAAADRQMIAANQNRQATGANSNFQATNVAYQLQDIVSTAALGSAPLTVALQQGPQLAAVFGETGAAGAVKTLGTAFMSLISPISLITVGLTAAAAAAIQYFMSGKSDADKFDAVIKRHQQNIQDIKSKWGEAASGISEYTSKSKVALQAENIVSGHDLKDQLKKFTDDLVDGGEILRTRTDEIKAQIERLSSEFGQGASPSRQAEIYNQLNGLYKQLESASTAGPLVATDKFKSLKDAIDSFGESVRKGTPDYIALRDAVSKQLVADPTNEGLIKLNKQLGETIEKGVQLQSGLISGASAFDKIAQAADAAARRFSTFSDAMGRLGQIGKRPLTEIEEAQRAFAEASGNATDRESRDDARRQFDEAQKRIRANDQREIDNARRQQEAELRNIDARSPAQKAAAAREIAGANVIEGETDAARQSRINLAGVRAQTEAEHALNEAQRDRVRALNESIASQQVEISLVGKTAGEQTALREAYQLTSQLRQEAARNGVAVDEKEIELIQKKAAEMGRLADIYARLQLRDELKFERDQLSRSDEDQQIASRLRGAGLSVDMGSDEARIIRENMRIQELREGVKGFFTDFRDGLMQGESIGDALGNAILNALNNVLTKLTNRLIDQLTNALVGDGASGSSSGSGLLGKLFSTGTPTAANDNVSSAAARSSVTVVGSAVDKAMSLLGSNEVAQGGSINAFLKQGGVDIDAARTAWCAGFVNSALEQVGVNGSGSLTANSFLNWGKAVDPSQILKGDVLVQSRGLGAGQQGGHVGFATGATRFIGGREQLEMLSGNSGNAVQKTWVNAMDVQARRATETASAIGKLGNTAGGATNGLGGLTNGLGTAANSLGTFGSGLGQFSQQLMSAASGANNPSSWLGSLGKLFGGVSPTSSMWSANTTLGSFLVNGYADGTESAPGGLAMVGERGRELVELPRGARVHPNFRTEDMLSRGGKAANVNVAVNVVNNNGSDVKVQKKATADGVQLDVVVDQVIAEKINTPGSQSRGAMKSQFGLAGKLSRR